MKWIQNNGLVYLQFPILSRLPDFFHGVFLGKAVDLSGQTGVFNLAMGCGMPEGQVQSNRQRMLDELGRDLTGVFARQVHGTQVGIWGSAPTADATVRLDGDALLTGQPRSALVIQTADCQSVIIVDPIRRVAANIHSGWRGSIANIIGRTVAAMTTQFQCRPQDLICGIGPSLGPCCAEFVHFRQEIPQDFWHYRGEGDCFDFWRISVDQLKGAGVPEDHIQLTQICTKCNQHLFFSYRGNRQTGRFATVVGIRSAEGKPG